MRYAKMGSAKEIAKVKYFLPLPPPFFSKNARISKNGISLSQPCTVLQVFLLSDLAEFSVSFFQHLMHYYRDTLTRQHFMCHGHYYGRVWNWFVEKLVNPNHACWCLSVLWAAIPESN